MPVPASGLIAHFSLQGAALSGAFMDLDVDRVAGNAFPMVFAVPALEFINSMTAGSCIDISVLTS